MSTPDLDVKEGDPSDLCTAREWFDAFCQEREALNALRAALLAIRDEMREDDKSERSDFYGTDLAGRYADRIDEILKID